MECNAIGINFSENTFTVKIKTRIKTEKNNMCYIFEKQALRGSNMILREGVATKSGS